MFVNAIHSIFFYVSLQKNILYIHFTNSSHEFEIGKSWTETRSGPIIGHYFCNMRNIWKTGTDRYTITIEQNVQFQVGVYHEKCRLDQIQNGRPAATFDRRIFSLTQFTQIFFYVSLQNLYPFQ